MTKKEIIECDWNKGGDEPCDTTTTALTDSSIPPSWGEYSDSNGNVHHFCPEHARNGYQWCVGGTSNGKELDVSHNYAGEEFEEVTVSGDTVTMSISQLIDEQEPKFSDYDYEEDEGWVFKLYEHLYVYIIGEYGSETTVVIKSDKRDTHIVLDDSEDSFVHNQTPINYSGAQETLDK